MLQPKPQRHPQRFPHIEGGGTGTIESDTRPETQSMTRYVPADDGTYTLTRLMGTFVGDGTHFTVITNRDRPEAQSAVHTTIALGVTYCQPCPELFTRAQELC